MPHRRRLLLYEIPLSCSPLETSSFLLQTQGGEPLQLGMSQYKRNLLHEMPPSHSTLLHSSLQQGKKTSIHKLNAAYKKEICCHEIPAFLFSTQVFNFSITQQEKTSCRTNSPTNNALLRSHG